MRFCLLVTLNVLVFCTAFTSLALAERVAEWLPRKIENLKAGAAPVQMYVETSSRGYLQESPHTIKDIRWHSYTPPVGVMVAELVKKEDAVLAAPAWTAPAARVEQTYVAESTAEDAAQLQLMNIATRQSGVQTEEILSFFQKTVNTSRGDEKTGAFVVPNQPTGLGRAPASRAELRLQ